MDGTNLNTRLQLTVCLVVELLSDGVLLVLTLGVLGCSRPYAAQLLREWFLARIEDCDVLIGSR